MIDDSLAAWLMHDLPDPHDGVNGRRPSWHAQAACRGAGVDMFITDPGTPTEPAKAVCAGCTVREPCLAYALTDPQLVGVWGGTTDKERRLLRRPAA